MHPFEKFCARVNRYNPLNWVYTVAAGTAFGLGTLAVGITLRDGYMVLTGVLTMTILMAAVAEMAQSAQEGR